MLRFVQPSRKTLSTRARSAGADVFQPQLTIDAAGRFVERLSAMVPFRAFFLCFPCCAVLASAQSINVENFNNPGATGAVIPGSSWVNNVTRGPDAITVAGAALDDNGWGATGQSLNATGMNFLTIFAKRNPGNDAPFFQISFVDQATLKTHIIAVSTANFGTEAITVFQVPIGTWPSGFNIADIKEWTIGGGTPGIVAFRMTLDHLTLSATAVLSAPTITTQPEDRVIGIETGTTLTVAATGSPTLRYQWKRNGTAISGATNPTLEFSNTAPSAADLYQVDVSNDIGTTPSRIAKLSVLDVRPTHALAATSAAGYVPGATVTITNTLTYAGTTPTALGWRVMLPTGWSYASDAGSAPETKPAPNTTVLAEWTWTTVPPSGVTFTYTLNVPGIETGPQSLTAPLVITQGGVSGLVLAKSDPLIVPAARLPHAMDRNGDYLISLPELTRLIQLYNTYKDTTRTGAYAVATTTTEDGFTQDSLRASGAAVTLTRYHSSDTTRDATISLVELTRGIELYNHRVGTVRTGQYRVQAGTEDGFAPGP